MALLETVAVLSRRRGDPTVRVAEGGVTWRTARTPEGPGTQRLVSRPDGEIRCEAWGPGADWLCSQLPDLLAEDDDASGFQPVHALIAEQWRRHSHWRPVRTRLVFDALVPVILEQKVTGLEARRSWQALLSQMGDPAPGPAPDGMRAVPAPERWSALPDWAWHRAGVGPERMRTIRRVAAVAGSLDRLAYADGEALERGLRSIPGIGPWTSALARQQAIGDPDAVPVGDYHLPTVVTYALSGEEGGDDARMLELLEPYAGHRYRALQMIKFSGVTPPRRGPRYAPLDHRTR